MSSAYRILMVAPTSFFLDYGCHVRILEEVRVLQKLGHQVTLMTYFLGRDLPGLEIIRTRPTPWRADYEVGSSLHKLAFDLFLGWTGLKVVARRRFDLVHGHLHEGMLIGYFLSRLRGVPLVGDVQGSLTGEMVAHHFLDPSGPWFRWVRLLEARIVRLPDVIVTSSHQTATLIEQDFACHGRPVHALPDCVNLDFFRPGLLDAQEVAARRAALGIPAGRPVVVYLGLLADYQGTPQLIRAARLLRDQGVDAHFLIMGFPAVELYRQMAHEQGVAERITFTGKVPYELAPEHLALGDIAVAPKVSATEGAGKILNYMAMALPTVAFDTAVSREYLGSLGVYAERVGSAEALAGALGRLLRARDDWPRLGQGLRERAARHFSWERFGRQLLTIYRAARGEAEARSEEADGR